MNQNALTRYAKSLVIGLTILLQFASPPCAVGGVLLYRPLIEENWLANIPKVNPLTGTEQSAGGADVLGASPQPAPGASPQGFATPPVQGPLPDFTGSLLSRPPVVPRWYPLRQLPQ
jgi:hypothetical protein